MTQDDKTRDAIDVEPFEPKSPDLEGRDTSMDPESMTLDDIAEAESSRPDIPGETVDGLDEMDEEVRRQAEDLPTDTPGRL
ncbi:hypothetical protein [Lichenibacterium ramalinae]|uniref:Uncharacterized protein n=1 Tax=Lichenibacterium ramalinae TaxID=2316527 RepID=A0A4Q2RDR7_9HYPH|nr:hypothetical protein [Lichenibacterium ramalinae]RYB04129.1 hypothetical protein D3272_14000 [Lichenibacterium ramalinae]